MATIKIVTEENYLTFKLKRNMLGYKKKVEDGGKYWYFQGNTVNLYFPVIPSLVKFPSTIIFPPTLL